MRQNRDALQEQSTSEAWSLSDPIERLQLDPVVTGQLHHYDVRTLEDLLLLPSKPQYEEMPIWAFRKIDPLIDQVQQLFNQEVPRAEEAEEEPPKPQQASKYRELDEQLTSLEQSFAHLGTQLSQMAREIADSGGVLPSDKLIEDLMAARDDFLGLRARILELANAFAISPLRQPDEIITLRDLRPLLEVVAQAEEKRAEVEQRHQRALTVLERVLLLVYRNSDNFPPLAECQAKARELRDAVSDVCWPALHRDTAALAEGTHPLAVLLTLSERWKDLVPRDWEFLRATVGESFGTELAAEAARGMLIIPGEPGEIVNEDVIPETPVDVGSPIAEGGPSSPNFSVPVYPNQPRDGLLSLSDPIDVLQSLAEPAVADRLRYYRVRTIEDLLKLSDRKPLRPNIADPTLRRIHVLIAKVSQLLEQEVPGFEGAEDPQRKPQQPGGGASKLIQPIDSGGRPRGPLIRDREEPVKPGGMPHRSKPEIVCWKSEQRWMVAIEVPEELIEQSGLEVLQNGECLVQDEDKADCWLLQQAYGQVIIHWQEAEADEELIVTLSEERYLLFKLRGQDLNQGRRVAALSTGSYLVMAPENWERDEVSSGANPVEPEFMSLAGYRAYFYTFERRGNGQIIFRTPEDKPAIIKTKTSQFELVGTRLQDASKGVGFLFGCRPPQIRALDTQIWTAVGTIVLGEEGRGRQRWRMQFRPDTEHQEQDLPLEVAARGGGWYFVRMYDTNDNLLESLDFRFVCSLKDISIPLLAPLPSEDGHKPACVGFLHEPGCDIQLADSFANNVQIERQEDKTIAIIPPCPALDETRWLVGSENTHQTQVTILVERLWWTIGGEHNAPSDWQDRPLTLRRRDFAPTSRMALWLRFPRPRWVDSVRVGFDQQHARPYPVKVEENLLAIPLQDFYDAQEITDGIGIYSLNLALHSQGTPYKGTAIILLAKIGCKFCNIETTDEEEMFRHIVSYHINEHFRSLTYEEMRGYDRSLPLVIYKCPYCSFYPQKDGDIRPTSAISDHVERSHIEITNEERKNVSFSVVHDVNEIRQNVIRNLPNLSKCKSCENSVENENIEKHLWEHRKTLYKMI